MNRLRNLQKRTRLLIILFTALLLGFWAWGYFSSSGLMDKVIGFFDYYSRENRTISLLIFWIFAVLSVLLGPFTSAPLVPFATVIWGDLLTFALLFSGWVVGGLISYFIGRYAGYAIVKKIISEEEIKEWEDFLTKRATFIIALLFRLAMPAETGYFFGILKYNLKKYLLITFMVELPIAGALVFAGDAIVAQDITKFISWVLLVFILLAGSAYLLYKRLKQ